MQRLLAITALTWKAAFRFRLFWVLAGLLIGSVIVLPLMLKDDGTARGFTQILLTYTLSVMTTLLGFATLWLSCGTLARDIEDCSMQMVAVKPIARWQIWLGKWLGILLLLLSVSRTGHAECSRRLDRPANHRPRDPRMHRTRPDNLRGSLLPEQPQEARSPVRRDRP